MGLLPSIIIGALLIVAFTLSAQQRLDLNSRAGAMPARQIAYLMRAHHQSAVSQKLADPALDTIVNAAPPTMTVAGDYTFLSCIHGKIVMTAAFVIGDAVTIIPFPVFSLAENNEVVTELRRQSVLPPELGLLGRTPWAVGYNGSPAALIASASGIGLSDEVVPSPIPCLVPSGVPAIVTQVLP
jgi:hypothetical protein